MSGMTADQNSAAAAADAGLPLPTEAGALGATDALQTTGASLLPAKPAWRGWLHAGMFPAAVAGASC